jgi:dihydrodipicolinate synthase/N-acetylneuraminate lyase
MVFDAPAVLPALLTPFGADGAVDVRAVHAHVDFVIEAGVQGVMPCGTTGETALLEPEETLSVVSSVVDAAAGRVPVVAQLALAAAWRDGDDAEAERLQEEVRAVERELAAGSPLSGLKQRVAELMAACGAHYPAGLRSPLGT